MDEQRPLIAITMGDPAGIGPEIIVGAWTETVVHEWCRPLVVGNAEILRRAAKLWQRSTTVEEIDSPQSARPSPEVIPCLVCGSPDVLDVAPGTLDARAGQAAYDSIITASRLALDGKVDAITTAPLQKEALHRAGHNFPGHTELLAYLCGVDDFAMMLYVGPGDDVLAPYGLTVVHVTLHTALRNAIASLTPEAILAKARLADRFMSRLMHPVGEGAEGPVAADGSGAAEGEDLRRDRPRIGVCALNPHAGEGGLFGDEECTIIRPAVMQGISEGLQLEGPLPADTLMLRARDGHYDAVVAMFHDQGHIALKLLGMHRAVNITLGLPIIRTSVAHGTAFDIAWQGKADPSSFFAAIHCAATLAAQGAPQNIE